MEQTNSVAHPQSKVIIIALLVILGLLLYIIFSSNSKRLPVDNKKIAEYEISRDALERQNDALQNLAEEQVKTTKFFAQRDSAIQSELKLNRKALEKIKFPHEIYTRFNHYTAGDWSAYFAALPDPGQ